MLRAARLTIDFWTGLSHAKLLILPFLRLIRADSGRTGSLLSLKFNNTDIGQISVFLQIIHDRQSFRIVVDGIQKLRGSILSIFPCLPFCAVPVQETPFIGELIVKPLCSKFRILAGSCNIDRVFCNDPSEALDRRIIFIQNRLSKRLQIDGILVTRYNARTIFTGDMLDLLQITAQQLQTKVYKTRIRESVSIKEAQNRQQPIYTYNHRSNGAKDYTAFIEEFLQGMK